MHLLETFPLVRNIYFILCGSCSKEMFLIGSFHVSQSNLSCRSGEALFDEVRERTWYVWFDEVYPPTPAIPEIKCKSISKSVAIDTEYLT